MSTAAGTPTLTAPAGAVTAPARARARRATPYLVAFAAAAVGAGLGRAMVTSYLPVLLDRIRDAPGLIGAVMLVNAATGFAVPLAVGVWSDRLRSRHGRRRPFILGGSLVAAGGLVAIGLGSASSYVLLAAFGAVAYVGLNALTTVHRAMIRQSFAPEARAGASSAQETATLAGSLLGVVIGGALIGLAGWAPFLVAACLLPPLALLTVVRVREGAPDAPAPGEARPVPARAAYRRAALRPGVRAILAAEVLWVLGYAALPVFFILYAERVLGLGPAVAAAWLAGFGVATGAALVACGRIRNPALNGPLVRLGAALTGAGFLGVALTREPAVVALALLPAAVGFGLISALGFPLLASFIPDGEEGLYAALFSSVRSIASALALPAAGLAIAFSGSYRSLFLVGGLATLAALVPLATLRRSPAGGRGRVAGWARG